MRITIKLIALGLILFSSCFKVEVPADVTKVNIEIGGKGEDSHVIELHKTFYTISLTTEFRKIDEFVVKDGWKYEFEFMQEGVDLYKLLYKETIGKQERCLDPEEQVLKVGHSNKVKFNNICK